MTRAFLHNCTSTTIALTLTVDLMTADSTPCSGTPEPIYEKLGMVDYVRTNSTFGLQNCALAAQCFDVSSEPCEAETDYGVTVILFDWATDEVSK